jgi:superfamily II DNA helicase RecQ
MQIKLFTIPIIDNGEQNNELNRFLRTNKVLEIDNQLIHSEKGAYWCFCVKYLEAVGVLERNLKFSEKIDYKEALSPEVFKQFSTLREIRKQIAQNEGLPAFAVFTDAELSELAKMEKLTLASMQSVKGIGEKKIEKFGSLFLNALAKRNET